jgi:pyruvate kinase
MQQPLPLAEVEEDSAPHAVAAGSAETKAIVGFTSSGTTVARISRKRSSLPILAITPDLLQVARRMALMRAAHSLRSDDVHSCEEMVKRQHNLSDRRRLACACTRIANRVADGRIGNARFARARSPGSRCRRGPHSSPPE